MARAAATAKHSRTAVLTGAPEAVTTKAGGRLFGGGGVTDAGLATPKLNRTFQLPIIVSFLLLGVAGVSAIVGTFSAATADRALAHSLEVRQAEAVVYLEVQAAETGQR